ncbi:unnamed protein product, partial [Prorocentrum cordatum]
EFQTALDWPAALTNFRQFLDALLLDIQQDGMQASSQRAQITFDRLQQEVTSFLDQERSREALQSTTAQQQRVTEQTPKGVGGAHRWTKDLSSWQPQEVKAKDWPNDRIAYPSSGSSKETLSPDTQATQKLPPHSRQKPPEALRKAARTFSQLSSQT